MTRDEAIKLLDGWFSNYSGFEIELTFVDNGIETIPRDRFPVVAYATGRRGFVWYIPDEQMPHTIKLDDLRYDSVWEVLTIKTDRLKVDIQPLRLEELVSRVERWRKNAPGATAKLMIDLKEHVS